MNNAAIESGAMMQMQAIMGSIAARGQKQNSLERSWTVYHFSGWASVIAPSKKEN